MRIFWNVGCVLFVILTVYFTGHVYAQQSIPKNSIPSGVSAQVKQKIEMLFSKNPEERARAAYDLGKMGEEAVPAIPFLIEELNDMAKLDTDGKLVAIQPFVGMMAGDALRNIGEPAVEPLIEALLHNKNLSIRGGAAEVLGRIKNSRAVDSLIMVLNGQGDFQSGEAKEGISGLRATAAYVLGEFKDPRSIKPLIQILKTDFNEHDGDGIVLNAMRALMGMQEARASEAVYESLNGKYNDYASTVIGQSKGAYFAMEDSRARNYIFAKLKNSDRHKRVEAVLAINDAMSASLELKTDSSNFKANSIGPLISALTDEADDVRRLAVDALGKTKDFRVVESLIACLKDPYDFV